MTGKDVTKYTKSRFTEIAPKGLKSSYHTQYDPRLNTNKTLKEAKKGHN